ncbi:M23 family metallopeptidase [Hymenobacter taeanensis]|uniref:M23 family metallopeptidase n=1 Tax=Hymenobacter taeanensis TaxID=2735321 RepID=A0A6M6BLF6_9BACT|nr:MULTISPECIES: M23 family metallopeptidase [Hymenobacter]QJX48668.1 M23 family metallopeptidase [Hymenobacter taeanensis]UOQ81832.1 M23 family metallopeptidase [Hymenobacter sp. 5414T-23]
MLKPVLITVVTSILWCLCGSAYGQTRLHRVYKVEQTDGRVAIFGINQEVVPYSVLLEATLTHMQSSTPLPARVVLAPAEQPQLLAIFTPTGAGSHYNYTYHFDLGAYTGLAPDTSAVYALPCNTAIDSLTIGRADNQYLYTFRLHENAPVLAAREGVVAAIHYGQRNSTAINSNLIYVYHNDGTHACYENIKTGSATVQVGQWVKQGELIAYFGHRKQNPYLWFSVEHSGATESEAIPVTFRTGSRLVRPR